MTPPIAAGDDAEAARLLARIFRDALLSRSDFRGVNVSDENNSDQSGEDAPVVNVAVTPAVGGGTVSYTHLTLPTNREV